MNFTRLVNDFIKEYPEKTMPEYKDRIIKLMGKYNVKKINEVLMNQLLIKFDHMEYEAGYCKANVKLIALADSYQKQNLNMRKVFKITSSSLYEIIKGNKVSIKYAVNFCKLNNLKYHDYFTTYSIKKVFSIEVKENTKCRIRQLFEYAIDRGIIETHPVPHKYRFKIDSYRTTSYIPTQSLEDFVKALFNYKNINGRYMAIIYILIRFNRKGFFKIKYKDIDFKNNVIRCDSKEYKMSNYISDLLEEYFYKEVEEDYILSNVAPSYFKTIIYRLRDIVGNRLICIETLDRNYNELIRIMNEYDAETINKTNYKELGLETKIQMNDFKEFLKLKKQYEAE